MNRATQTPYYKSGMSSRLCFELFSAPSLKIAAKTALARLCVCAQGTDQMSHSVVESGPAARVILIPDALAGHRK
jgi:hypothetical protein